LVVSVAGVRVVEFGPKHPASTDVKCLPCCYPASYRMVAYAGYVLKGSSGRNALIMLEGKMRGKRAKGRPRRMWFDDVRQWTALKDYTEVKRNAEDREAWRAITRQPST